MRRTIPFAVGAAFILACSAGGSSAEGQSADGQSTSSPVAIRGRVADPRIAFIRSGPYITRWHLTQKNPGHARSDVVQPIVYYLDKTIPPQWIPYVTRGVEEWLPAFDAIGFRHALVVRPEPAFGDTTRIAESVFITMKSDPGMAADETPPAVDAETGRITSGMISFNYDMVSDAGRAACAALFAADSTVPLPCPDSILGIMLQGVIAHEVGHSLGLDHNFHAGIAYPTDSLRSASFVRRWGHTPSVMGYRSDFNSVAQPEDRIPLAERWMHVGVYDRWAIAWAYRPIPSAETPEAEQPTLEQWRSAQDTASYLRVPIGDGDPREGTRAMGGSDALKATTLYFQNRARLARRARSAAELGSEERDALQRAVVRNWRDQLIDLTAYVGGRVTPPPFPRDHGAVRPVPVTPARQIETLQFILAHALYGDDEVLRAYMTGLTDTATVMLFESARDNWLPNTVVWREAQREIVARLLSPEILARLRDQNRAQFRPVVVELCRLLNTAGHRIDVAQQRASTAGAAHARALRALVTPALATDCGRSS